MKALILIFTLIIAQNTLAKSNCLPYDLPEDKGVTRLRSFDIKPSSALSDLQKKQISIAAHEWAVQADYTTYNSFKHAIEVMKNDSEGGDLYYTVFKYKNQLYTMVEMYPGGNAFAVIFKDGKKFAERHDGDIICSK